VNAPRRDLADSKLDRKATASSRPSAVTDRRAGRIAAAERSLADAHAGLKTTGVDPDAISIAFAVARDCIAEAKECSEKARSELALAQAERLEARRERLSAPKYPDASSVQVVPDAPGLDLCPNPARIETTQGLIEALRAYWVWAGKPSYRAMERRCGRRFAASTIHAALHGNRRPSLDMVRAIITGCGGSSEHRQAFASAWRRLEMPPPAASQQEPDVVLQ
jgi:hypothetical protein